MDDIRDLRAKILQRPTLNSRYRVYIIDEVHMLSTAAFNALLKTLEEPPPHGMFVLATTEEHKVPVTIKSRCQQFNFRLLTVAEISHRLQWLAAQEDPTIEPEALNLIARQGAGSVRDAESLLDQLVITPGDTITLERTQMILGTASEIGRYRPGRRLVKSGWQRRPGPHPRRPGLRHRRSSVLPPDGGVSA
ncbi:MAG: hypothetical protein M5U34_25225 [Chloroflexi bacterium]|nr:hypothetical protein [Chloroflexota bacterium]